MLKELIATDTIEPVASSEWRASVVGECETFLCHMRLGESAMPMTGRVRHLLDDGLMHEHDVINRLIGKGIKVLHSYQEGQAHVVCYEDDEIIIQGHPDGILDVVPDRFMLDYTDDKFRRGRRYYLLEVTAPSHFTFLRLEKSHMRSELWRKYVQIQMYMNSEEFRSYGDGCIVEVKNKNTSALYEEGVGFDDTVIKETVEKLKRVTELTLRGIVSSYRCSDWRRYYCRYRHLCYGEDVDTEYEPTQGMLEGESLGEAEQLLEAADLWLKGKNLEADSKELIGEARNLFLSTITDYNAKGLLVGHAKALMIVPTTPRLSIDFDLLKQRYPNVYEALVNEEVPDPYLRVTRR